MRNLLALDVASKTGWKTRNASGVWDLRPKRDESKGLRLLRFKKKLLEIIEIEDIDLIVFERSSGQHKSSIIVQSEMHGILKTICEEYAIQYKAYSPAEIKRHATGKGNCNKDKMVQAAKQRWPDLNIIDNNHADALWIYDLTEKDLL